MKRSILAVSLLAGIVLLASEPVFATGNHSYVVSRNGQAGWKIFRQCYDANGNPLPTVDPSDKVTFVKGPSTPPSGTGSLQLQTGGGTTGGDCQSALRNLNFAGVKVAKITQLSYWTYMSKNNGQQFPFLSLNVNYNGGNTVDDTVFFEPPYQTPSTGNPSCLDQGPTQMNTWQLWKAGGGCWWSNSGNFGTPGTGVVPLKALVTAHPNATIVNPAPNEGGVRLVVGEGSPTDQFQGNADAFTINVASKANYFYNFE
jgi:hypothetical protein